MACHNLDKPRPGTVRVCGRRRRASRADDPSPLVLCRQLFFSRCRLVSAVLRQRLLESLLCSWVWGHLPGVARERGEQMKRLILGFAVVVAIAVVPLASATARSGTLKVDKNCRGFTGGPGSFCTFFASNVAWAPVGTNIFYLQPGQNPTDVILDPPGPGNNKAFGSCDLPDGSTECARSPVGRGSSLTSMPRSLSPTRGDGLDFHWEGPYSFSPK